MKKQFQIRVMSYALCFAAFSLVACEKSDTSLSSTDIATGDISDPSSLASTIAVVSTATAANADSVYLLQPCKRGSSRDSVAQADLPAAIGSYLNTNYAGNTFHKAYAIKNSSGTITGYAVVVYFNDKPVGLEFDASGAFLKVLEQRERGDLHGSGHHRGGRFQHRDGKGRDSVALTALPASVLSYFATNYGGDTLVKAYKTIDSGYVVLSKNTNVFVTTFNVEGSFVKRDTLDVPRHGKAQEIEASSLPAAVTSYLSTTYPGYVYKKAFAVQDGGTIGGYVVFIDANNTSYAVSFDAAGTFKKVKSIY